MGGGGVTGAGLLFGDNGSVPASISALSLKPSLSESAFSGAVIMYLIQILIAISLRPSASVSDWLWFNGCLIQLGLYPASDLSLYH